MREQRRKELIANLMVETACVYARHIPFAVMNTPLGSLIMFDATLNLLVNIAKKVGYSCEEVQESVLNVYGAGAERRYAN